MQSNPDYHAGIHPALTSFADECVATLARLIVYIGALILLGIVGLHLWDELPVVGIIEPAGKPGWSVASRSRPAFAVSSFDPAEKSETYEILRHPKAAVRTSSIGAPRAKSQLQNSNFIVPAPNSADRKPSHRKPSHQRRWSSKSLSG